MGWGLRVTWGMGMVDMNMYESSGGQLVDVMISAARMGMVQAKCGFWMEKNGD